LKKTSLIIVRVLFIVVMVFFESCKSTKKITSGDSNLDLSAKQLIKENEKQSPEFKTLQAKLKISYSSDGDEQTHSVTFRIKKDEVIWINSAFSVIRAMITPEKVSFYNKLDNTYFDGNYKYLSDLLGTELDYEKVQNLLLGETLFDLNEADYNASVANDLYVLQPKKQQQLFEIFYLLSPSHFKVKSQQISQPKESRHLQIDYLTYQDVNGQTLPENIKIIAVEGNKEMIAELEFKSVSLNEDLRFPFSIPSGFDEIKLK
jgi:outer membrane biogenesis lipoprotein LolB